MAEPSPGENTGAYGFGDAPASAQTPGAPVVKPGVPMRFAKTVTIKGLSKQTRLLPHLAAHRAGGLHTTAISSGINVGAKGKPTIGGQFTKGANRGDKGTCNHCGEEVGCSNASWQKRHLGKCDNFLASDEARALSKKHPEFHVEIVARSAEASALDAAPSVGSKRSGPDSDSDVQPAKAKIVAWRDSMSKAGQATANMFLVKMLILSNLPYSWVERPEVREFLHYLRPAYVLPSRYKLAGELLLTIYMVTYQNMMKVLMAAEYMAITMDGWSVAQVGRLWWFAGWGYCA